MTIPVRNVVFMLASALAGFLSGLTNPLVFGARGAIVGYLLSAAVVLLQPRRRSSNAPPPRAWTIVGLGIATSALATALISGWHLFLPDEGHNVDFQMDPLSVPARFATILCYAVPLLLFYQNKRLGRARAWGWFFAAPVLGALIRSWGYHQVGTMPFNFLIGALPGGMLWVRAAVFTDPAWTSERWRQWSNLPPAD